MVLTLKVPHGLLWNDGLLQVYLNNEKLFEEKICEREKWKKTFCLNVAASAFSVIKIASKVHTNITGKDRSNRLIVEHSGLWSVVCISLLDKTERVKEPLTSFVLCCILNSNFASITDCRQVASASTPRSVPTQSHKGLISPNYSFWPNLWAIQASKLYQIMYNWFNLLF